MGWLLLDYRRGRGQRGSFVTDTQLSAGHVPDEIFELVQLGKPFVGLIEVFDGGVDASGEGLGIFGGHGIGAEEFDLLFKTVLFGEYEGEVFVGLLETLVAFTEDFEAFEA
jgi:hypothetical protein